MPKNDDKLSFHAGWVEFGEEMRYGEGVIENYKKLNLKERRIVKMRIQKCIKRLFKHSVLAALVLLLGISGSVINSNAQISLESNSFVTEEMAYQVAVNFVLNNSKQSILTDVGGSLYTHGVEYIEAEGFPENFMVYDIEEFYDYTERISAYNVKIADENGVPCGYVIVSASQSEYPVIEYAYDGTFYMESVISEIDEADTIATMSLTGNSNKIYYNGNFDYAAEINNVKYHVTDNGIEEVADAAVVSIADMESVSEVTVDNNIEAEWSVLTENVTSAPIGTVITNPLYYESGYGNRATDYCWGMPSSFFLMSDLGPGGVCAPVAGTNLCYFWATADSTYSNLKKDGSWVSTFNRISELMGTDEINGTVVIEVRRGILAYFKERGYTSTEAYYSDCYNTTDFNDYIKAEINVGRPVIVALLGDEYYGNHAVLGVGYERYMYNGVWSSHYIEIADGWNSTTRYVHYETGRDAMVRIRVIPGA